MNKIAILYGDFGDIACITALSNLIYKETKEKISLVTKKQFVTLAQRYGSFKEVFGFDLNNPESILKELNHKQPNSIIVDLHNFSYCTLRYIEWYKQLYSQVVLTQRRFQLLKLSQVEIVKQFEIAHDRTTYEEAHNAQYYLNRLGYKSLSLQQGDLRITADKIDLQRSEVFKTTGNIISIVPNSNFPHKEMKGDKWKVILEKLFSQVQGLSVFVLCASFEVKKMRYLTDYGVQIMDVDTFEDYIPLLCATDLVISVDTGIKHLAGYLNKPVIGLYGHSSPKIWGTMSSSEIILQGSGECIPCNNPFDCHLGNAVCVDSISSQKIIDTVLQTLKIQKK